MGREYFCAYHSYLKSIRNLSDAECGRLFKALLTYSAGDTLIKLQGREEVAFDFIAEQIDRDTAEYDAKCERLRENGKKAFGTKSHQMVPDGTKCEQEKEKGKEEEKEEIPPKSPTGDNDDKIKGFGYSDALETAVRRWLAYKRERKESYRPTGLNTLLTKISRVAAEAGDAAVIEAIEYTMAANWQGIVWDRLKSHAPPRRMLE